MCYNESYLKMDRRNKLYFNLNSVNIFPKIYAIEANNDTSDFLIDYKQRIREYMSNETGADRLRRMFSRNEYGMISPELKNVVRSSFTCAGIAGIFGALSAANQSKVDFIRRNTATPFESQFLARRKMTDTMTLAAINAGFKQSVKFGSFACIYLFLTTTASTYNNKVTIFEHIASGAIVGGIVRLNYGLKGTAVASCLGGILGLIAGGVITLVMKMSGITFEEMRYVQHESYWSEFYAKSVVKKTET